MTYLKIKGQEASSWLKMVTRKMKLEVLPDTVHKLSPPQARKNCFIWMGHLYGAFGPGTTCWPGGGLKCSPGVGGSKMASRGVDWLLAPPTPTYGCQKFATFSHLFSLLIEIDLIFRQLNFRILLNPSESERALKGQRPVSAC